MEILLSAAYTAFFIFLIGKMDFFRLKEIKPHWMKAGFLLKVFAGISVGLVYTYYYTDRLTADTFKFFDDSKIIFDLLYSQPLDYLRIVTGIGATAPELQVHYDRMTNWYDTFSPYNDNRTLIRLNAVLRIFSMGYYYVHVVVVCFLSFTGIIAIVKVFKREYPMLVREIFLVFLLLPSVLFWCSGLLKDSLVFFALGAVLLLFDKIVYHSKSGVFISLVFITSLLLLMITKFQVFLLIVPLLAAWWISARFGKNPFLTFAFATLLLILSVYVTGIIFPEYNLINLLIRKQAAFFELAIVTQAGSMIYIPELKPGIADLLITFPRGFITALTRPFVNDTESAMMAVSAAENTVLLLIGIFCLSKFKMSNIAGKILPVFCLFYVVSFFTLIGIVTPVLGAIVRYKAQALPFLFALLVIVAHTPGKSILNKYFPPQNN